MDKLKVEPATHIFLSKWRKFTKTLFKYSKFSRTFLFKYVSETRLNFPKYFKDFLKIFLNFFKFYQILLKDFLEFCSINFLLSTKLFLNYLLLLTLSETSFENDDTIILDLKF